MCPPARAQLCFSLFLPNLLILRTGIYKFDGFLAFFHSHELVGISSVPPELGPGSKNQIKFSLYSPYYAEACNELRGPLRGLAPEQHSSESTSQRWRAVGDTVSDLTGPGIKP